MKFCLLTDDEFQNFAYNHPQNNFFQSLYMKELLLKEDREVYLLGLKDKEKILCATLLASSNKFLGRKTYEALKGILIDYNDKKTLKLFMQALEKFALSMGGYRLIIDPYIPNVQRDSDANILIDGIDNRNISSYLNELGYTLNLNNAQVKWTYCLDTEEDAEDLFKKFKPNTRNCINKTINKYKLQIEELEYKDLDIFKKITQDTCNRRGFADRSLKYYQNMYQVFDDQIKVLIAKLNCNDYLNSLYDEKKLLKDKLNNLSDSASNKKKKENIQKQLKNINKNIKEIKELKNKDGNEIILSGAMFILYGDEIVYLFSGSYEEYMKYYGQYALQWFMIKYACEHNYKRYNFYGIKDIDNKDGKDYGVYAFKKGFNGYVEELLGAYEKGLSPLYNFYQLCKNLKNVILSGK